jgi:glycosyltransferase involved in cell wall biosynthesis
MRLGYTVRASRSMLLHPGQGIERVRGRVDRHRDRREKESLGVALGDFYGAADDWAPCLHAELGLPWPCPQAAEFAGIWDAMVRDLTAAGLRVGMFSYGGWNDGDRAFGEATWCMVAHLRPERVVETGVAHGLTSRIILQGLERNGAGHLWSVDLPAVDSALHSQIGIAVPPDLRSRWIYLPGTSRDRLPGLLRMLGGIDLFVHDSLHTGRNTRFELESAWPFLRPGGAAVVDDIDHSLAFSVFTKRESAAKSLTARHIKGDGLWGVMIKETESAPLPPARRNGHILMVVENLPLGIDQRLRKQVRDLLDGGFRVSVVTRKDPENLSWRGQPGLSVLEYPAPPEPESMFGYVREYAPSFSWALLLSVAARLRGRIDVVQFCLPPDIYFSIGRLLNWTGVTVVADYRDLMPELFAARYDNPRPAMLSMLRWLERRTQRVADHTICTNEYFRERLIGAGASPEQITIVGNGPVLARVEGAVADPALRGEHKFLCCWIGKMGRQDRVDLLVDAIGHIVHGLGRTDCGFFILGDGECLDEVKLQSVQLGLEPWVHFPGWLTEEQVFSYLAGADLGLDTSLQADISPVKIFEYMAFGVPVVAFDVQETRAMSDGAAALVAPGDVKAYARALVALLDDSERRVQLAEVGRARVRAELAWERQSAVYLELMRRLCHRTRTGSHRTQLRFRTNRSPNGSP